MHIYKPYNFLKPVEYGDKVFQFDPTVPTPVPDDHEDFGKTLAEIYGMTDEEANSIVLAEKWAQIRKYRDEELIKTDWVSGEDIPQAIKDAYYPYRQSFRDITNQEDPDNIVWAKEPTGEII